MTQAVAQILEKFERQSNMERRELQRAIIERVPTSDDLTDADFAAQTAASFRSLDEEEVQWSGQTAGSRLAVADGRESGRSFLMSVQDIESAVSRLSTEEFARFSAWFEEYAAAQWDKQIEADILAGRFDAAGDRATAEFEAGRCKPL